MWAGKVHAHEETLHLLCHDPEYRSYFIWYNYLNLWGFFWVGKFFFLERTRKECPGKKGERNNAKPKQLLSSCASSSSITAHQTMQASGYDFMKAFIKCPANHQLDSQDSHCIANCQPITTSDQLPQSSSPQDDGMSRLSSTHFCRCPRTTCPKTFILNCRSQTVWSKSVSGNSKNGRSLTSASTQSDVFTGTLSHRQVGEYLERKKREDS